MHFRPIALAGFFALTISAALYAGADASARGCKSSETRVPGWGCVSKREIAKARRTCKALKPPASFRQCLCQDGKTVGACGD
jgi:hypothetical protein